MMSGSYNPSQVQLLVGLCTSCCGDSHPPPGYLAPVVPAFEAPHYAFRFAGPNIPHGLVTSVASFQGHPVWSVFPEPVAHITNRYAGFHHVDDDLNNILRIRSQWAVDQLFP